MANALRQAICLLGIVALMAVDGINGTLLVVNRGQVMGGYAATPDEAAWLNIAYLATKLIAFVSTPWLVGRYDAVKTTWVGGLLLAVVTGALAMAPDLTFAIAIRAAQGACGALVLVAAQTLVFQAYPATRQPLLQSMIALAVVVVPVMVAPALHGWVTDAHDWRDLFVGAAVTALLACVAFHSTRPREPARVASNAPRPVVQLLLAPAIVGVVYVMQEGARFDWFDAVHIRVVAVASVIALACASWFALRGDAGRQAMRHAGAHPDFVFGLCASFFAGFALFGSGAAIPLFGNVVLSLAPEHVGQLALSSSIAAAAGLALAGLALQSGRVPVVAPIPVGIALFMTGMWLLSLSSAQTGAPQMLLATWLRGFGMGLLFVSLTVMTLGGLPRERMAGGVALFNLGRQAGGLAGMAFVSTMLEWRLPAHGVALWQHVPMGSAELDATQATLMNLWMEQGLAAGEATTASAAWIARQVQQQSAARAFDEIFLSLAMFFVVAIPLLLGTKALLARQSRRAQHAQRHLAAH
ncbi:MFS transporter [Lysobacter sp. FW306-1B-D06B]|uniref:MFS transporter n=1 Tax=Lysobacter sp. FW306-1B-D06B TaxID=3140250 RepID=UPI0031408545